MLPSLMGGVVMTNIACSYLRFSTSEQAKGDSRRRQIPMAEKYAADHHLKWRFLSRWWRDSCHDGLPPGASRRGEMLLPLTVIPSMNCSTNSSPRYGHVS
jgi:hypothetical protein